MKATMEGVRNEPLDRGEVMAAVADLLGMLDVRAADVAELHVTASTVRVRLAARTRRGKRIPNALVTVTHKLVLDHG